jgi:hypothetical protein
METLRHSEIEMVNDDLNRNLLLWQIDRNSLEIPKRMGRLFREAMGLRANLAMEVRFSSSPEATIRTIYVTPKKESKPAKVTVKPERGYLLYTTDRGGIRFTPDQIASLKIQV